MKKADETRQKMLVAQSGFETQRIQQNAQLEKEALAEFVAVQEKIPEFRKKWLLAIEKKAERGSSIACIYLPNVNYRYKNEFHESCREYFISLGYDTGFIGYSDDGGEYFFFVSW